MSDLAIAALAAFQIYLLFVLYRYMTRKCPNCELNADRWSDDVLRRIHEWEGLLEVSKEITGWTHEKIVQRVVRKLDERGL